MRDESSKANAPSVTVITPVYNVAPYLRECLDGILGQTQTDLEVVCIDDGSTDDSPAILRGYANRDNRIFVITQDNRGPSAARNAGLSRARGRYVYFLDADDSIEKSALRVLLDEAETNRLDVLYFDGTAQYDTVDLEASHPQYENYYHRKTCYEGVRSGVELFVEMQRNDDYKPSPCLQFIRKGFLDEVGLRFQEGVVHEDCLFSFLCILQARRAGHVSRAFFSRRIRLDSIMTRNPGIRNFEGRYACLAGMLDYVSKNPMENRWMEAAFKEIRGIFQNLASTYAVLDEDGKEAARALLAKHDFWGHVPAHFLGRLAWDAAVVRRERELELSGMRGQRADELRRLRSVHEESVQRHRVAQEEEIRKLKVAQTKEIQRLVAGHGDHVRQLQAGQAERLARVQAAQKEKVRDIKAEYEQSISWVLTKPIRWLGKAARAVRQSK